jgi:hypothetical protein
VIRAISFMVGVLSAFLIIMPIAEAYNLLFY